MTEYINPYQEMEPITKDDFPEFCHGCLECESVDYEFYGCRIIREFPQFAHLCPCIDCIIKMKCREVCGKRTEFFKKKVNPSMR